MASKKQEREWSVSPPRPILPGLNNDIIGTCEPRRDTVGTKKEDSVGNRGVFHIIHGCDVNPTTVNVAQPDLFRVLGKISVDIENPCGYWERSRG